MRIALASLAVASSVAVYAAAADPEFKSGLQPGDAASPFDCRDITGPNKGKSLCYVWTNGARPVALVFARTITGPLSSLLKQLDAAVAKNKDADLRSFAVFLTDDAERMETKLKELNEKDKISENVPLTIVEDPAGPREYKIHKDAELTVLLYNKNKVVSNFAFKPGELKEKDVKAIVAQLPRILPASEELDAKAQQRARIQREVEEQRRKLEEAARKAKEKRESKK